MVYKETQGAVDRLVGMYGQATVNSEDVGNHLYSLGVTDESLLGQHRVGYADGTLENRLDDVNRKRLANAGLITGDGDELFKGYITIPIAGNGMITHIIGVDESGRHKVWGETKSAIWNMHRAKTFSSVFITDNIIHALAIESQGYHNVVYVHPDADMEPLMAFDTIMVVVSDKGLSNRLKGLKDTHVHVVNDDIEKAITDDALKAFLEEAEKQSEPEMELADGEHLIECSHRRYIIKGLENRNRKLNCTIKIQMAGNIHVDTINLYSSKERDRFVRDTSISLNQTAELIRKDFNEIIRECERLVKEPSGGSAAAIKITDDDREKALSFAKDLNLIENILAAFCSVGVVGDNIAKLLCYICMTSRLMNRPSNMMILSSSGAGKSVIQEATASFCPPEQAVMLTSISGKALFYLKGQNIKNKLFAIAEGCGAEDADYALRELISNGKLNNMSTKLDQNTNELVADTNTVEGPVAVIVTTTNPNVNHETVSRLWVCGVDESRDQTKQIIEHQRMVRSMGRQYQLQRETVIQEQQMFQRILRQIDVRNPLVDRLVFDEYRLSGRRRHDQYLNLIDAICLLRQYQKELLVDKNGNEYIEVDEADIETANMIVTHIMFDNLSKLSTPSRRLLGDIRDYLLTKTQDTASITWKRTEIMDSGDWKRSALDKYLRELIEWEYVTVETRSHTSPHTYRLIWAGTHQDDERARVALKSV